MLQEFSTVSQHTLNRWKCPSNTTGKTEELVSLDNVDWPNRLREGSENRDFAIQELRSYLLRGLTKSLTHRYGGKIQVEDVAQVALVKILASLDSFQGRSRFTTWAMSIATRVGISELRRHYYRDVSFDQKGDVEGRRYEVEDTSALSDEQHTGRQALFTMLTQLIQNCLSEKQRIAINGTLEGLPVEEIAVRLSSNRNAVYKLVHDARLRLRQGFEENGIRAEDIASTLF